MRGTTPPPPSMLINDHGGGGVEAMGRAARKRKAKTGHAPTHSSLPHASIFSRFLAFHAAVTKSVFWSLCALCTSPYRFLYTFGEIFVLSLSRREYIFTLFEGGKLAPWEEIKISPVVLPLPAAVAAVCDVASLQRHPRALSKEKNGVRVGFHVPSSSACAVRAGYRSSILGSHCVFFVHFLGRGLGMRIANDGNCPLSVG